MASCTTRRWSGARDGAARNPGPHRAAGRQAGENPPARPRATGREDVAREQVAEDFRPLLELPVEHVLATHGGPTDRAALERALS